MLLIIEFFLKRF